MITRFRKNVLEKSGFERLYFLSYFLLNCAKNCESIIRDNGSLCITYFWYVCSGVEEPEDVNRTNEDGNRFSMIVCN